MTSPLDKMEKDFRRKDFLRYKAMTNAEKVVYTIGLLSMTTIMGISSLVSVGLL